MSTVAIIGAGIGGVYLVAELGLAGHRLRLHDLDDTRLAEIRAHGGVDVEPGGLAAVESATTELPAAVDGADVIIVVTGGNAQPAVARSLAPLLRDGQIVLLIQGNTGGSLVVRRALDEAGCRADVDVAEMDNYPFSSWRLGPTRIRPIVKKRWLQIASFPGCRIDSVFSRLAPLFPHAVAAPNVIHTGFTNANAMLHVANCIGNAGKIDRGESYKFYAEGVTPSVARLYAAINAERVAVAAALGASVPTLEDWFDRVYGVRGADLPETCQLLTTNSDGPYQATGTPKSFDHKYITEDVPVGLMPMSALGAAAGVPTPAIDALITLARAMTGKDFSAEARTLERMGLAWHGRVADQALRREGGRIDAVQLSPVGCTHSRPVPRPATSARQALHRRYPLPCADRSGRGDVPRRRSGGTPAARCVRQPAHARGQPAAVRTNARAVHLGGEAAGRHGCDGDRHPGAHARAEPDLLRHAARSRHRHRSRDQRQHRRHRRAPSGSVRRPGHGAVPGARAGGDRTRAAAQIARAARHRDRHQRRRRGSVSRAVSQDLRQGGGTRADDLHASRPGSPRRGASAIITSPM